MTTKYFGILAAIFFLLSCSGTPREQEKTKENDAPAMESFMTNLSLYCGETLAGEVFADHQRPELAGSPMEFIFEKCTENEVRIRTRFPSEEQVIIILTLINDELLLKHDVRDANLAPGQFTMYGGFSDQRGSSHSQIFPVHNFGGDMWPGYENYSWEICIDEEKGSFEYIETAENIIKKHFKATLPSL
ncbi:MAG: hypothetical protein EA361_13115 [Bacteroidetes bacterium]|nr:MAG: hypothetical protein EA361_13115 [Bacteroidota bacterium]